MTLEGEYYLGDFNVAHQSYKVAILMTLEGEYYKSIHIKIHLEFVSQSS